MRGLYPKAQSLLSGPRVKHGAKARHVVAVEHLDIAVGGGAIHVVPHHLKHAVEVGGDDDMDELLRHQTGFDALATDDLHVLVGVLDLDVHQLVQEAGKPGAVGPVQ